MDKLLIFFSQPVQIGLFLAALAAGWIGRSAVNSGDLRKARTLITISFCASSLIAATNVVMAVVGSAMGLIMAALWGFFAYRDLMLLKALRLRKK